LQFIGIAISPTDPDFVIGGTQDNGLDRFSDSLGWTLPEGGDGGDVIMDPFNSNRMWRANPVGSFGATQYVRRSTDGGNTWTAIVNGITNTNLAAFYPPMAADPGTQNRIFLGTNVLNVSTNGGDNWTRLPGDTFTFPNEIRAIGIGSASPNTIYVACGASADGTVGAYSANQLFVTTNNGLTWTERTPQLGGDFENFAVDPTNSNIAYVVSANFSPTGDNIWKTTDAGATWTSLSANLPDAPFYDVILDPGATASNTDDVLYVSGDLGVYRSTDLGTTWTKFGNGLPTCQVRDIEYSPQTRILAAATHGRGVWEILTAPPPGEIFGTVYQDSNANGTLNTGEPGLAGWTVFRDDNNNGVIDNYGTTNFNAPGLPIALPDHNTTTSSLTVSGLLGAITDVNLTLNITHMSDNNLQVFLTDPAGTKVTMFANIGGTGQNFTNTILDDEATVDITSGSAPFTGTYRPRQPLSLLDGQSPNGTWTLTVTDTNIGNTGTLNSWSIAVTTGEPTTNSQADGTYALRGNPAGTYTIRRVLQSGWFATEPLGGAASVTIDATHGARDVNFGQTTTPPVRVASVVINGGEVQRSRVTQVQISFDQLVVLPPNPADAFQIRRVSDNALVALTANVTNTTTTSVTLTFNGALSEFGSLADGRYTLTIFAAQVSNSHGQLDGNGDGVAGDNFSLATRRACSASSATSTAIATWISPISRSSQTRSIPAPANRTTWLTSISMATGTSTSPISDNSRSASSRCCRKRANPAPRFERSKKLQWT
jgi:subtilisin-like proprotein convertase family protein